MNEEIVNRIDEYLAEWKDATIFDELLIRGLGLLRESCYEIERLREQLRLANIDNFNTTAEVERLRAERDEARREVCHRSCCMNPQTVAKERNWNCFDDR